MHNELGADYQPCSADTSPAAWSHGQSWPARTNPRYWNATLFFLYHMLLYYCNRYIWWYPHKLPALHQDERNCIPF